MVPAFTSTQDGSGGAASGRDCEVQKPSLALAAERNNEALLSPWLQPSREQPHGRCGLDLLPAGRARLSARARPGRCTLPVGTIDQ